MTIQFLSIMIFTFALTLVVLGAATWWIERGHKRVMGVWLIGSGLFIAIGYALLGSRFAITWFGRLIVAVDLPRLWATATLYTIGVLGGIGLAGGLFMWMSGRLTRLKPTRLERQIVLYVGVILAVALVISVLAMLMSR